MTNTIISPDTKNRRVAAKKPALTPLVLQRKLFRLLADGSVSDKRIIGFLETNVEVLNKQKTIGQLWGQHPFFLQTLSSPYLESASPAFLSSLNYFNFAAGNLRSPSILEKIRTQMNVDINNNAITAIPYASEPVHLGVYCVFLEHTGRGEVTVLPKVVTILDYLAGKGYDFQNKSEFNSLEYYSKYPPYYEDDLAITVLQHISVLIEKQKITKNLPKTLDSSLTAMNDNYVDSSPVGAIKTPKKSLKI